MSASKHVAFLRGINVGRAKRVAMADLRAGVESLGYGGVRTLLNSGNVVFTAPGAGRRAADDAASRIEAMLAARLGVTSRVTVLTAAELADIVAANPLLDIARDPSRLLVAILNDRTQRPHLAPLLEQDWAPEALAASERAAYLWCCEGILASRLAEALGRVLRDGVTSRNWTTILKLHALVQDEGRPGTAGAP
jgi:uncharacterized protein (DUF1697 family)